MSIQIRESGVALTTLKDLDAGATRQGTNYRQAATSSCRGRSRHHHVTPTAADSGERTQPAATTTTQAYQATRWSQGS